MVYIGGSVLLRTDNELLSAVKKNPYEKLKRVLN